MLTSRRLATTATLGIGIILVAGAGVATASGAKSLLLGRSNSAKSVTTLSNSRGTALSLKAKSGKPPLAVNNKVQVPNLNSSLLDGKSASSFQSKIKTDEQCNHQPGSKVTGLASNGEFTCDNQQAVQNGRQAVGNGTPTLAIHDLGEYLIFANVDLQNTGTATGTFKCEIAWSDPTATGETEADETFIPDLAPNAVASTAVALTTSGAHNIPGSTTLTASCSTTTVNADATVVGGDITALPVTFQ